MNFFEAQDRARRNTAWMVLSFIAAIVGLIASVYVVFHYMGHQAWPTTQNINADLLIQTSIGLLFMISAGSLYKLIVLRTIGGAGVAQQLGGRLVNPATQDAAERRLINITGEMALASGCPPPQLYILPDQAINAFAAGHAPGNAVIGVTHGTLALPRDQLQGIIAHEFSHIINGDMRLNMRLMGIIHGIMLLSYVGYFVIRATWFSYSRESRKIAVLGLVFVVIGSLGAFFGNLIRAAVSRQREFLADAAAVQYTRNPQGIGGALQSIAAGASHLQARRANECAHLFFSEGVGVKLMSGMLATHPPLRQRIKRILPEWDGKIKSAKHAGEPQTATPQAAAPLHANISLISDGSNMQQPQHATQHANAPFAAAAAESTTSNDNNLPDLFALIFEKNVAADTVTAQAGQPNRESLAAAAALMTLPQLLENALSDSYSARALVYAVLLDECSGAQQQSQLQHLEQFADEGVYALTQKLMVSVAHLPHAARLPLLLRAVPALRLLSPRQYRLMRQNMATLIAADGQINVFEWSVQAALLHHLQNNFGEVPPPPPMQTRRAWAYTLSTLARAGGNADAKAAFASAAADLPYDNSPFSAATMSSAMHTLLRLRGNDKKIFMDAAAAVAAADSKLTGDEIALLRAFAALLDCPLPLAL